MFRFGHNMLENSSKLFACVSAHVQTAVHRTHPTHCTLLIWPCSTVLTTKWRLNTGHLYTTIKTLYTTRVFGVTPVAHHVWCSDNTSMTQQVAQWKSVAFTGFWQIILKSEPHASPLFSPWVGSMFEGKDTSKHRVLTMNFWGSAVKWSFISFRRGLVW